MAAKKSALIEDHFAELTDPRRREGTYPLISIVVIAVCAVICGADDFVAIAEFGRLKKKFLERSLDLSAGIPSQDRFNAILAAIKPAEFEKCLLSWITALHEITAGQVIAIDGKTLRRGFDAAFFTDHIEDDFARVTVRRLETRERGHRRNETRFYFLCPVPEDLPDKEHWHKLRAIGIAINGTIRDGKETSEVRYYILSKFLSARRFADAVRGHRSIENRLHWGWKPQTRSHSPLRTHG